MMASSSKMKDEMSLNQQVEELRERMRVLRKTYRMMSYVQHEIIMLSGLPSVHSSIFICLSMSVHMSM